MTQVQNFSAEDSIQISELVQLIQLQYSRADRAVNMLFNNAKMFGKQPTETEVQQARLPYEKTAEAYQMVLEHITARKIRNSSAAKLAADLKIVEGDVDENTDVTKVKEVQKPKATAPVKPEIKDEKIKKEADSIIADVAIEDSIAEAVYLSGGKTTNEHWKIAQNKVRHFYKGGDELSSNPTDREINNLINTIMKRVSDRKQAELEGTMGIERPTAHPVTTKKAAASMPVKVKDKFNYALIGIGATKTEEEKQDKVKLMIIREMSLGHVDVAKQIAMNFYSNKEWDEVKAGEFVKLLMKKDPHKELNTAVYNILKDSQEKEGNATRGIKLCRSIVGMYFGTLYAKKKGKEPLDNGEEKNNKKIDRFINRQLEKVTTDLKVQKNKKKA